ncbi:FAS1-like dehydratase domain-containing protein [Desulfosporosinus shakirovi]|uniref:FAS1-like dehydratase domain-containing protein n=1 Tax=Desulfosporosinus shakirovi TaxID=2885154 RepID=UPI001E6251F5|nr:MaoC family dehydratase N-terminal domain-containing protein [Desulfosporosinus sp. SRJS8]MCB8817856.1 MaoC family dehydratase N-terminal domain-containing protein [Desulfosporosinus sp. SRJS8]
MIGKELIGRQSESVVLKIEHEEVCRFAETLEIQFDDRVPATFVETLTRADIPGFKMLPGMIHGEQKFTYHRPLLIGDILSYKLCIKDVYERTTKLGKVTFFVIETTGINLTGEQVFTISSTFFAPTKETANE